MHGGLAALLAGYDLIVLEGCDGVGKTTLAEAMARWHGYQVAHSGRTPDGPDLADRYRRLLATPGRIILDRSFISELVYGPLDHGRSRLTLASAIELAHFAGRRGGVLVHLTGDPVSIAARLTARDGPGTQAERIGAIVDAYRRTFSLFQGTAPVITADTTARGPGGRQGM